MSLYQYQALVDKNGIRILHLDAAGKGTQLRGSFITTTLKDAPDFETLSYVWGEPSFTDSILIEGSVVRITPALACALHHLRFADRPRKLWVDAICIDQDNIAERNQQVAIMSNIYQKSKTTLAWFGAGNDIENHALEELVSISKTPDRYGYDGSLGVNGVDGTEFLDKEKIAKLGPEVIEVVEKATESRADLIYSNAWFERLWIVQEAVISQEVIIHLGDTQMDWYTFQEVTSFICHAICRTGTDVPWLTSISRALDLVKARFDRKLFAPPGSLELDPEMEVPPSLASLSSTREIHHMAMRLPNSSENTRSYWFAFYSDEGYISKIWSFRDRKCKDDRDYVYGLGGFIPWDVPIVITPDYSKSVPQVFTDFARAMLDIGVIELFLFAGLWDRISEPPDVETADLDSCPSWVPELRLSRLKSGWIRPWKHALESVERIRFFETPVFRWHEPATHRLSTEAFVMEKIMTMAMPTSNISNSSGLLECIRRYFIIFAQAESLNPESNNTQNYNPESGNPQNSRHEGSSLKRNSSGLKWLNCFSSCFGTSPKVKSDCPERNSSMEGDIIVTSKGMDKFIQLMSVSSDLEQSDRERLKRLVANGDEILTHLSDVTQERMTGGDETEQYEQPEINEEDRRMMILIESLSRQLNYRAFFATFDGHSGFAPQAILPGDVLVRFFGLLTPYIVRPVAETSDFRLIGPCYIQDGVDITKGVLQLISLI